MNFQIYEREKTDKKNNNTHTRQSLDTQKLCDSEICLCLQNCSDFTIFKE